MTSKQQFFGNAWALLFIFGLVFLGIFFGYLGRLFLILYIAVIFFLFAAGLRQLSKESVNDEPTDKKS